MKKELFSKGALCLGLIAFDFLSKRWALHFVSLFQGVLYPFGGMGVLEIPGFSFSLNRVMNSGIAWGLFPNHPEILLFFRLFIVSAFLIYILVRPIRFSWAFCLILAGAIGNILDMLCYGHVIDFLHARFFGWSFPIFNIADSLITAGAALLLLFPDKKLSVENR